MKRILYLAPEIPSLSATFVYNEIFAVRKAGADVDVMTVHAPEKSAHPEVAQALGEIDELYQDGLVKHLVRSVLRLLRTPGKYLKAIRWLMSDLASLGFGRTSVGQVYRFLAAASLAEHVDNKKCQHIHVHFAHVPTDLAMYASAMCGATFSFMGHANDLFERGWLLREKVSRSLFCASISEFNRNYLRKLGADIDKIRIVRCGIDPERFALRPQRQPGKPLIIGALGRLVEKKGFDVLIAACQLLHIAGVEFTLKLAGDGPLKEALVDQVKESTVAPFVEFVGALPHSEVHHWLSELDVFVLPCKVDSNGDMDGIPVVLMEAMAIGVPVISTKISGIPELILDHETGLLVEPNDAEATAMALKQLVETEGLSVQLVDGGRQRVETEFSEGENARRLLTAINTAE